MSSISLIVDGETVPTNERALALMTIHIWLNQNNIEINNKKVYELIEGLSNVIPSLRKKD